MMDIPLFPVKKVSQLPAAEPLGGTERIPLTQGGRTVSTAIGDVKTFLQEALVPVVGSQVAAAVTAALADPNVASVLLLTIVQSLPHEPPAGSGFWLNADVLSYKAS